MIDLKWAALVAMAYSVMVFCLGIVVGYNAAQKPDLAPVLTSSAELTTCMYTAERAMEALDSVESWVGQMTTQPITMYVQ